MPMQPSPSGDTARSGPRLRCFNMLPLSLVDVDLALDEREAVLQLHHVGPDRVPVRLEEREAIGCGVNPGEGQLGVATHLANRHARTAQLGQDLDPAEVAVAIETVAVAFAPDRGHQARSFVVAEGVSTQTGCVSGFAYRQPGLRVHAMHRKTSSALQVKRSAV